MDGVENEVSGRVREALEREGIGQAELARRLGIAADKISKSLKGVRNFTSTELARIARETGDSVDWLISGTVQPTPKTAGRVTDTVGADAWLNRAEDYARADANLRRIGRGHELTHVPEFSERGSFVRRGEEMASWALAQLAAASCTPWSEDFQEVVEDVFTVDVAIVDLPAGCHGFTWQTDEFRLICLARSSNWARQRFTFAHELSHILSGDAHGQVLKETSPADWLHYFSEKAANAFAGAFLMPAAEVNAAWQRYSGDDLISRFDHLAWDFKVSPASLAARLQKLGLIDEGQKAAVASLTMLDVARYLNVESAFDRRARSGAQARAPRRLLQRYREAFDEGVVSVRPLAKLADQSPEEYLALSDQTPSDVEGMLAFADDE